MEQSPPVLRRQPPGTQTAQMSISLAPSDVERIRKEAHAEQVSVSLYLRNVLHTFWNRRDEERVA